MGLNSAWGVDTSCSFDIEEVTDALRLLRRKQ